MESGNPLDMSLDDLIKKNKQTSRGGRGGGGGGGGGGGRGRGAAGGGGGGGVGPIRRPPGAAGRPRPPVPYANPAAIERSSGALWEHDLYANGTGNALNAPSRIETGTKLRISNIDYGVSDEDIKELFSEVGVLKRHGVHYDRSGRSKGTAEVVYARRTDAVAAMKRYNNVLLDGKPMKIELIENTSIASINGSGMNVAGRLDAISNIGGGSRGRGRATRGRGGEGRGQGQGQSQPQGRGRGQGQGRGGQGRGQTKSVAELDAELDTYHSESMQVS